MRGSSASKTRIPAARSASANEAPPLRVTLEYQHVESRTHAAQGSPGVERGPSAVAAPLDIVTALPHPCLSTLAPGARVRAHLLVVDVERRRLGSRPATLLTLANASGRLPSAPLWDEGRHRASGAGAGQRGGDLRSDRYVPRASAARHRAHPPNVEAIWSIREHCSPRSPTRIPAGPRSIAGAPGFARPGSGASLRLFYDDPVFRRLYEECPASPSGHHAALGGLLRHTFEVASIGRAIAAVAGADRDLVLAGALLHDIGKLEAYTWSGAFEVSPAGALLGHVALGARMLDRTIREAADAAVQPARA